MPGPHETNGVGYPVARAPGAGGYASATDAPHEASEGSYPEALEPGDEGY